MLNLNNLSQNFTNCVMYPHHFIVNVDCLVNILRQEQIGHHLVGNILNIFHKENFYIAIKISQEFVPKCLIDDNSALVQVMAQCWKDDKPLPEPVMTLFTRLYTDMLACIQDAI